MLGGWETGSLTIDGRLALNATPCCGIPLSQFELHKTLGKGAAIPEVHLPLRVLCIKLRSGLVAAVHEVVLAFVLREGVEEFADGMGRLAARHNLPKESAFTIPRKRNPL